MTAARIGARLLAGRQMVVDVPPVLGGGVCRVHPERLDGVDCPQDLLDLRPTRETQQALTARAHAGHGRVALAWPDGAQNVYAGDKGGRNRSRPSGRMQRCYLARTRRRVAAGRILCSSTMRPKRIQFSMRFLSHVSSTRVSSLMGRLRHCRGMGRTERRAGSPRRKYRGGAERS